MKEKFEKIISNVWLQKSDLKKIFYYIYKYKIAIYISGLLFYKNDNFMKIAIIISF